MSDFDSIVFAHPARVLQQTITGHQELLQLAAEQHAWDPDVFRTNPPFFWPAEISSNRIDAYFTRMMQSSLQNYASELAAGVSFQNSHQWRELGFGRSLTGRVMPGEDVTRVVGEFYTIPGLRLNGVQTDDFILGVRAGIAKDVSIGWYGGQVVCNICQRDMFRDWDCDHIPGFEYMVRENAEDAEKVKKLAVGHVENAHLAEVSAVYDGATPGAAIVKATQEAEAGRLKPEAARVLEVRYRIAIPGAQHTWPGVSIRERNVDETEEETEPKAFDVDRIVELNARIEALGCPKIDDDVVAATEWIANEIESLRETIDTAKRAIPNWPDVGGGEDLEGVITALTERCVVLTAEIEGLRSLAADGKQYRVDLLAEALTEGVRAYGQDFQTDTYTNLLQNAPIATIKRMRDDWKQVADHIFQGGRKTVDEEKQTPTARPVSVPDAAYAA